MKRVMKIILKCGGGVKNRRWPWLLSPIVDEGDGVEASLHLSSDLTVGTGSAAEGVNAVITDGVLFRRETHVC